VTGGPTSICKVQRNRSRERVMQQSGERIIV
jgi:hypothetical protein